MLSSTQQLDTTTSLVSNIETWYSYTPYSTRHVKKIRDALSQRHRASAVTSTLINPIYIPRKNMTRHFPTSPPAPLPCLLQPRRTSLRCSHPIFPTPHMHTAPHNHIHSSILQHHNSLHTAIYTCRRHCKHFSPLRRALYHAALIDSVRLKNRSYLPRYHNDRINSSRPHFQSSETQFTSPEKSSRGTIPTCSTVLSTTSLVIHTLRKQLYQSINQYPIS